ncbi:uncharacterized protein UV8b_00293 [Ustilaginoidea virens]|uniref:Uncharacterized protein n=1 Tax=Ustilaginoidea virens TaxID=1159556 RepID=A0A8E5MDZ0_USTVR|nr:uncharacterized protein UV8b_00293 [Ustilaginoidea virens]QUC16052.1 hypothetical protein UV8b_00293 [Ustilaginoidea virens]
MCPPPTTPAARRFLLPKRSSGSQTPGPQASQFQSTPRFGSSSAPRPAQGRAQGVEDVDEDSAGESRSDPATADEDEPATQLQQHVVDDTIEAGSAGDESQHSRGWCVRPPALAGDDIEAVSEGEPAAEEAGRSCCPPDGRGAKRRRVLSISPDSSCSAGGGDDGRARGGPASKRDDLWAPAEEDGLSAAADPSSLSSSSPAAAAPSSWPGDSPLLSKQHQPVFVPAPRFKPAEEADEAVPDMPPLAFSPPPRGSAKYLPGGLAAHLQGWLSEVRGWEDDGRRRGGAASVAVEEVSPGRHMYLVGGRGVESREAGSYVLAGEGGKLPGLAGRAAVTAGSVVLLGEPVWEVDLEGRRWTVACNWSVVS